MLPLFPAGVWHYLIGGFLIGAGVSFIYLMTGLLAGASGVYSTTLSYIIKHKAFQTPFHLTQRNWRLTFALAMILGGFLYTLFFGEPFTTQVQWWRLAVGGFLVGYGTRLSRGCTSGHGICGLSALSLPSLLAVITFLVVAIIVALLVKSIGIIP